MFSFASVWIFDESEIFSQVSSYQLIGFCLNMKFIQVLFIQALQVLIIKSTNIFNICVSRKSIVPENLRKTITRK